MKSFFEQLSMLNVSVENVFDWRTVDRAVLWNELVHRRRHQSLISDNVRADRLGQILVEVDVDHHAFAVAHHVPVFEHLKTVFIKYYDS